MGRPWCSSWAKNICATKCNLGRHKRQLFCAAIASVKCATSICMQFQSLAAAKIAEKSTYYQPACKNLLLKHAMRGWNYIPKECWRCLVLNRAGLHAAHTIHKDHQRSKCCNFVYTPVLFLLNGFGTYSPRMHGVSTNLALILGHNFCR